MAQLTNLPYFSINGAECIYCKNIIQYMKTESLQGFQGGWKVTNKWNCPDCDEIFYTTGIEDEEIDVFCFTCYDISIHIYYKANYIGLARNGNISIEIPTFYMDTSNKEKLYEKLKTYLLFS